MRKLQILKIYPLFVFLVLTSFVGFGQNGNGKFIQPWVKETGYVTLKGLTLKSKLLEDSCLKYLSDDSNIKEVTEGYPKGYVNFVINFLMKSDLLLTEISQTNSFEICSGYWYGEEKRRNFIGYIVVDGYKFLIYMERPALKFKDVFFEENKNLAKIKVKYSVYELGGLYDPNYINIYWKTTKDKLGKEIEPIPADINAAQYPIDLPSAPPLMDKRLR